MKKAIKTIWKGDLTGTTYASYGWVVDKIKTGSKLRLVRDPKNVVDQNAIEVHLGDTHIGWVPKAENKVLARLMDIGCDLKAVVLHHDPSAGFQKKVLFAIGMTVGEEA